MIRLYRMLGCVSLHARYITGGAENAGPDHIAGGEAGPGK